MSTTAIETTPEQIIAPCVHLNGTSKQELMDNLESIHTALEKARDALKAAAPNGRDYYLGTVTIKQAQDQQIARMRAIDDLQRGIETEMEMIDQDRQ